MKFLRKYGEATTITFGLRDTDGVLLKSDAVYAAGDVKISKDEGADTNISSGFADEGLGYSMPLSGTEMEAARIQGYIEDQGTPAWLGREFTVETYGHANAQYPYMNEGIWDRQLTGATHNVPASAGRRLRAIGDALSFVVVADGGNTALTFKTDLPTKADGFYNDQVVHGVSGGNATATKVIENYIGATGFIILDEAFTETPSADDEFDLRPEHIHPISQIASEVWDEDLSGSSHNIADSSGRRVRNLQELGSYGNGNVYIDTINGSAGTTPS